LRRTIEISQSNKYLINYSNIQTKLLPYILDIKDYKNNLSNGLPLCYPIGLPLFDYDKDKKFKLSKKFIAKYFFLTKKLDYIGIKLFFEKGNFFTFNVKPKKRFLTIINKISDHNLRVKKKIFDLNKKYKKVCAFQTRNIPHSGHEAIIKYLLKSFDHVVINPVIGPKKKGDIKLQTLEKVYNKLINDKYKKKVSFLPIYFNMFYAGPKEAAHHALIRQNLGFKYFIVGRDHAGAENLYKPNAAINLLKENKKNFKIKILTIKGAYYCKKCKKVLIKSQCEHKNLLNISGTSFRSCLKKKFLFKYADQNLQNYIHRNSIRAY
jgi:sulfate adenylyltransferase